MDILSGLLGHASEINIEKLEKIFEGILGEGEQIEKAYKVIRDLIVFTNLRLVFVDKKGITGKKTAYHSIFDVQKALATYTLRAK
jgi:Bacterial PH domain